ncbi:PREDICTED: caskin-1-like [Rhinopithecus bieti]|uniref:caskin-1-like n=1 Tax=Rhinopithecus bieti TaxID=61621 RepID=UPI00083C61C1|nr:PREDICTED: caskin-1-like [Rhinopithecus bieti]
MEADPMQASPCDFGSSETGHLSPGHALSMMMEPPLLRQGKDLSKILAVSSILGPLEPGPFRVLMRKFVIEAFMQESYVTIKMGNPGNLEKPECVGPAPISLGRASPPASLPSLLPPPLALAPHTCGALALPSPAASSPPLPGLLSPRPWDPPLRQPPPRWLPLPAARDSEPPLPLPGLGAPALRFSHLVLQLRAPRPRPPLLPCAPHGWPRGLQRAAPVPALGVPQRSPGSLSRPCRLAALQCRPPAGVPPQAPALATQALSALSVAAAAGTAGWELPRSVLQAPGRREPARLAQSRSIRSEGPLTPAEPARGQSPRQTANREAAGTRGGRGGRIAGAQEFETRLGNILPPACKMRLMDSCSCGSDVARPPQHSAQGSQEE